MSLASEWILTIHRAIWFPVLFAMGLEGQAVEVMDRRFRYTAAGWPRSTKVPSPRRTARRKAA